MKRLMVDYDESGIIGIQSGDEEWNTNQVISLLLKAAITVVDAEGLELGHVLVDDKVEPLMDEFDNKLLGWCVKYVHALCTDDNGTLEMVTEQLQCSEVDLFDGCENISQVMGFSLDEE